MKDDQVVIQQVNGALTTLVINRPASLNALNREVLEALETYLVALSKQASSDPASLRALIITGAGEKAFVAGADISMMDGLSESELPQYVSLGQRVMRLIESLPVPVLAQVQGFALGGGMELALACDLIIASSRAKLGQPEVNLGIIPGFGGTQRLVFRCGLSVAKRLCLTGEHVSAEEALRVGLIDYVFPPEELTRETEKIAETIMSRGPLAVRKAKRLIQESVEGLLLSGLTKEADSFVELFSTKDRVEGFAAFLGKRAADFTGE